MRIFFIGQKGIPATYGGVEHHVEQLATRLSQKGHQVWVYARPWYQKINYPYQAFQKEYQHVNILNLPSLNTKNLDAITASAFATFDVLFRQADIIHYQAIGPSSLLFLPRLLKLKSKIVATFHCKDYEHQKWGRFAKAYLKFGEYVCVNIPHGTISVSKSLQEYAYQKYHKETAYIPNGVPIFSKKKADTIKNWGLEKDKYLLTVARLVKHKNIHHLIKAYLRLYPKNSPAHPKLVIVGGPADGGGKYEKELHQIANENSDIIFTGYQTGNTLAELFSNTYLYVHPSASEGLPIAVLEAMAYGKCALVSNIPENIEPIADFGFSFRVGSINDLEEKLKNLLQKPQLVKETGEKAKSHVRKTYNWDQIVEKTDEFYENMYHLQPKHLHPKDFTIANWDRITDLTENFYFSLL